MQRRLLPTSLRATSAVLAQAAGRVVSCCKLRSRVVPVAPDSMKERNIMIALLPFASTCGGGSCKEEQPSVSIVVSSVSFAYLDKIYNCKAVVK